jgi:hypothetical protein
MRAFFALVNARKSELDEGEVGGYNAGQMKETKQVLRIP